MENRLLCTYTFLNWDFFFLLQLSPSYRLPISSMGQVFYEVVLNMTDCVFIDFQVFWGF